MEHISPDILIGIGKIRVERMITLSLQSVRFLRPPPLFLSDYRTRRGIEKSANGHLIPRLDINQEIPRMWFGLQAMNRLHFSPNLSFEVARPAFPGIFSFSAQETSNGGPSYECDFDVNPP
jgi:hypothetical protein